MRLSILAPALTVGLLSGWAAMASADTPPAAPIFYCPAPVKAASAADHAKGHGAGCPTLRQAHLRHRKRAAHTLVAASPADNGVSASQAFIYGYERALGGLNARAAHEAWAGVPPRCPNACPPARTAPPPLAQQAPPPAVAHPAPPPVQAQPAPPPPPLAHQAAPTPAPAPAAPPARAYAGAVRSGGSTQVYRDERSSGWSYSEQDGQGHYMRWGDDNGRRWSEQGAYPPGPPVRCPPPVPPANCAAGQVRQGDPPPAPPPPPVYLVAGRDAHGFLTWPGKVP